MTPAAKTPGAPVTLPGAASDSPAFVAALRAGEPAACVRLVRELTPRLLPVARRMMRSDTEAEDAVQEAFASGFRHLNRFDGQSKLSTWMHRITVNACLMRLRAKSRRPERAIEDLLPTFDHTGHQTHPSRPWNAGASAGIEREEELSLLRTKIDELPESYRCVLMLRDVEGLSTDEAAHALQITPNTVKIRLHRARLALKELLEPHFGSMERSP